MEKVTEILLLGFLTITFLQSGLDKAIDWKGNLGFLQSHFAKTFLKGLVPILLVVVLVVEVAAGILCVIGIAQLLLAGSTVIGLYGAALSCIALLMLLFGQRIAKDYEGAKTIAIYFIPAIFAVFLLQ